ncbi:MAG: hypothetical protein QXI56_08285 [Candidatus Bathyarchaeia archaeon]
MFTYNVASAFEILRKIEWGGVPFDVVSVHDWLSAMAEFIVKDEVRNFGGSSPTVSTLELTCTEKADSIITVSCAMRNHDLALQGFLMSKVHVVWNGVDPEKFSPTKVSREVVEKVRAKHAARNGLLTLFIGRFVRVKGVDKLVEVMPYVLRGHPDARCS